MAGGKWIRLSLPCAALALLLALPGAASAAPKHHPKRATESYVRDPEPPHALISVRGTNGYEIRISITQGSAFAFATGGFDSEPGPELDTSADYSISRARANAHRVRAKFGRVGLVSARFVPSGKVERFRDPNCKGGPEVTRRGAFVGTIRFEGEDDFTRFSAHRARGTITSTPRQICRLTKDVAIAERSDGPKHFLTSFFASAVSDDVSTYFVASVRELEPQVAEFEATRFEDRGNMFITREVEFEDAPAAGFVFDAGLDHATLAPPAPFAGNATFTRIDDFASRWEGPLTVSFPGAANVPLTGRAYAWGLDRSTDPSDFVEGMFP